MKKVNMEAMTQILDKPDNGAVIPLFAATSPKVWAEKEKYGGAYLVPPGVIGEASTLATDPKLARELWEASERVTQEALR